MNQDCFLLMAGFLPGLFYAQKAFIRHEKVILPKKQYF
jgi:hypothetical protein